MTVEDRNYLFEEKAYLVNVTMNKHRGLTRACHMEDDDVYQQLSLRLVNAIDRYDPARCPNIDAYIMLQLRYELLHLRACSKRTGVAGAPKKGFSLVSLDARDAAGFPAPAPAYADETDAAWLVSAIASMPPPQKGILARLLAGKRVNSRNKTLQSARLLLRARLMQTDRLQYA
jgi:DNA-directed RNA polymerase specialized sigma24 family protein